MSRDLNIALEAAKAGLEVIRSFEKKDLNIQMKGRHDLVTDADVATEKAILKVIRTHCYEDIVVAEESASEWERSEGRVWFVDPIDGTTNFAYGFPVYCISIALWVDGEPTAAVVLEVNREELFTAERGKGAFLNGEKITVSSEGDPDRAFLATGFPYTDHSILDEYIVLFRRIIGEVQGIRRPGAATWDLCCVACGRFQGFWEYGLSAWDVAAASLIVREAGGVVTDWKGGSNWLWGRRIIAANPAIHQYLKRAIVGTLPESSLEIK
ncbi:MAG: inositol monophosphatase family protein [Balneolaceae bacterium]